jgi:hypothetical protein
MNFSDFKRLLGADPYSQDPEFLRARNSGDEFTTAAEAADRFEKKLQGALLVDAPDDLTADILKHVESTPQRRIASWPMALAASLFMMVGAVAVFMWNQGQVADLEAYVFEHYQIDGVQLVGQARTPASIEQIQLIMASVNASAGEQLAEQVYFIKNCPTPDGTGAHLVLMTEAGPVTVFYLPETEVLNARSFEIPGMHAFLVDLQHGAAAVIGPSPDSVQSVALMLDSGILPATELST